MLCLLSFMHAFVDGICASTVLGQLTPVFPAETVLIILLYNLLAFSTQGLTGLLVDRLGRHREYTLLSSALVILGLMLPCASLTAAILKTCLVGLGNSLFHVAAGAKVILASPKKALPMGIFVAPGAMGLTLGTLFPSLGGLFAVLLAACAVALCFLSKMAPLPQNAPAARSFSSLSAGAVLAGAGLLFCIFSRAFGGSAVSLPWKTTVTATLLATTAVVAGKMLGGLLCDRFGPIKLCAISIPSAALLLLLCSQWMLPSLLGQLLLNLSMPVTLWLLCQLLPESPGFAFGLAASCLYPGTLFAQFLPAQPAARTLVFAAVFALNTVLMLFSSFFIANRSKKQLSTH